MLTADSRLHRIQSQQLAGQLVISEQACDFLPVQKSGVTAHLLLQPGPKSMPVRFSEPESTLVSCTCLKCMHSATPNLCIVNAIRTAVGISRIPIIHIILQSIRSITHSLCSCMMKKASRARSTQNKLG